jgi:anti-sigma factor RsiW
MSEQDQHAPFDDELLSAYLDDELTPDERARVQRRLETDPAARQLLDQLRAVSQAVRDLPREAIGEDLRHSILQRASTYAAQPASEKLDWPVPQLSIGRTMRGWVWAGLAVAAALLIMFLQPHEKEASQLPASVALRRESEHTMRDQSLELRARDESHAATAEPAAPSTDQLADSAHGMGRGAGRAAGAGSSAASPATTTPMFAEPLATSESSAGGVEIAPSRQQLSAAKPALLAGRQQPLLVRVQVTPVAFQNKAFDGLLVRNGIELQQPPAQEQTSRQLEQIAGGPPQMDAVLVDAPAAQVESCLADLKRDTDNYLAVEVEEKLPRAGAFDAKQAQADPWKKYSRGRVPSEQKVAISAQIDSLAEKPMQENRPLRNFATEQSAGPRQNTNGAGKPGQARRVQLAPAELGLAKEGRPLGEGALSAGASPGADTVQVLFVFSTDAAATPSPGADNPAE